MKAKREMGLATHSCYYVPKLYAVAKFNGKYSFVAYALHIPSTFNELKSFFLSQRLDCQRKRSPSREETENYISDGAAQ